MINFFSSLTYPRHLVAIEGAAMYLVAPVTGGWAARRTLAGEPAGLRPLAAHSLFVLRHTTDLPV